EPHLAVRKLRASRTLRFAQDLPENPGWNVSDEVLIVDEDRIVAAVVGEAPPGPLREGVGAGRRRSGRLPRRFGGGVAPFEHPIDAARDLFADDFEIRLVPLPEAHGIAVLSDQHADESIADAEGYREDALRIGQAGQRDLRIQRLLATRCFASNGAAVAEV